MSKQALVDHAVKRCYEEYSINNYIQSNRHNKKRFETAKDYTIAWFSVWWDDVKMIELTRAIEKAEAENAVQP